jgi:hypothetical protein
MKKFALLICAIMLLMSVNPVVAANQPPQPVGDQINLLDGDQAYPADTAFFIAHYFSLGTGVVPNLGRFDFKLEIDGQLVNEDFVHHVVMRGEDYNTIIIAWLFNFPDGMQGEHTFEGHWIVPCSVALQEGLTTTCSNPGAPFQYLYAEANVTFIAP